MERLPEVLHEVVVELLAGSAAGLVLEWMFGGVPVESVTKDNVFYQTFVVVTQFTGNVVLALELYRYLQRNGYALGAAQAGWFGLALTYALIQAQPELFARLGAVQKFVRDSLGPAAAAKSVVVAAGTTNTDTTPCTDCGAQGKQEKA